MGESSRLARALGNRDVIYAIGKAFGKKFKPWGAYRGAANVAKAGAVFGVAATAFDIYSWVRDSQQENGREAARRAAVEYCATELPGSPGAHPDRGRGGQRASRLTCRLRRNCLRAS